MYDKYYKQHYPPQIIAAAEDYWKTYGFNAFFAVPWGWEFKELGDVLYSMTIEKLLELHKSDVFKP